MSGEDTGTDQFAQEEGNRADPEVVASNSDVPGAADAFMPQANPAFMPDVNKSGMQQPLSHGRVDPTKGIEEVGVKLVMSGINLGQSLMSGSMPSTSEWVYGTIDIVAGAVLANQYMGKGRLDKMGFYLSMLQLGIGALTAP